MTASIIREGDFYSPTAPNGWEILDMKVEDAIKTYSGKKTILLMWSDDKNENIKYTAIMPSFEDSKLIANLTADNILNKIRNQLILGIGKI